ncbi:MAG TPA: carbohydrate kinase family protein [Gemmatimonadales bacterium]|nr:carbohydrate kinase family protein [Gemmatimonadales bacterium]
MKRLGVMGTMVWDTIYRWGATQPVEEWGGVAYALAALEASLPPEWSIVPLIKVGRDLAPQANTFLHRLTRRAGASRLIEVPEPNNRITLRYLTEARRAESLRGGVPGWTWAELGPMVRDLDALYINFISGREVDLPTATALRRGFPGPIYADLHSLFLHHAPDGSLMPCGLPDAGSWFACFDVVQLNEEEMGRLDGAAMEVAARALAAGVRLLVVTVGARGTIYFTSPTFTLPPRPAVSGPVRTARVPAPQVSEAGDPTGCGDVLGATLLARLLAGDDLELALTEANRLAARNVSARGATDLQYHLRGELLPR